MSALAVVLMVLLLAVVLAIVTSPLNAMGLIRNRRSEELMALEAERDSKYQEIRDAELDYRMGKHSSADYAAVDAALRAEALEILNRIEALAPEAVASGPPSMGGGRPSAASAAAGGPPSAASAAAGGPPSTVSAAVSGSEAGRPSPGAAGPGDSGEFLQQDDRVQDEQDREEDRPAVQVALDERAAAQRTSARADAEGA